MADIETNHAMNDNYYFDGNFPNAKLRPYDDYKNMSTFKYILWHFAYITIKNLLSFVQVRSSSLAKGYDPLYLSSPLASLDGFLRSHSDGLYQGSHYFEIRGRSDFSFRC